MFDAHLALQRGSEQERFGTVHIQQKWLINDAYQRCRLDLKVISPKRHDVQTMFDALDRHHLSLCPPEICHLTTTEVLDHDSCVLIGAFEHDMLCGIGGLKSFDGYGEITRMYVAPAHRGRAVAERILEKLISVAKGQGLPTVRLETSDKFEAAMKLYFKHGFVLCAPFGDYVNEPYNTYLEKRI